MNVYASYLGLLIQVFLFRSSYLGLLIRTSYLGLMLMSRIISLMILLNEIIRMGHNSIWL